ncbi:MAG: hypothetical protein ACXAAO_13310 [Candidatus Thorarchaeota archaeon]|jgi:hypothetical protein
MKTKITILLIIVILFGSVNTSAAVNDQGLSWEVEVGDRINYRVHGENVFDVTSIDWDIYAEVDSVTELNETITSYSQMTLLNPVISTYWVNGTSYSLGLLPHMVLPIGNWSLMKELVFDFSSYVTEESIIETESTWGFTTSQDLDYRRTTTLIYSKTDGMINYIKRVWRYSDETQDHVMETIREGYSPPSGFDSNLLLYIGIGAGVVVILAILIIRRR